MENPIKMDDLDLGVPLFLEIPTNLEETLMICFPKHPDPSRKFVGLMVETSHPQNRIVVEFSSLGHIWILRVFTINHQTFQVPKLKWRYKNLYKLYGYGLSKGKPTPQNSRK